MSGTEVTKQPLQGIVTEALLDSDGAGAVLHVTGRTMRNLAAKGIVPVVRIPGLRALRFRPETLRQIATDFEIRFSADSLKL